MHLFLTCTPFLSFHTLCILQPSSREYLEVGRQVLYALQYVHEHGYSHGDVKAENICTDGQCGNAREKDDENKISKRPVNEIFIACRWYVSYYGLMHIPWLYIAPHFIHTHTHTHTLSLSLPCFRKGSLFLDRLWNCRSLLVCLVYLCMLCMCVCAYPPLRALCNRLFSLISHPCLLFLVGPRVTNPILPRQPYWPTAPWNTHQWMVIM